MVGIDKFDVYWVIIFFFKITSDLLQNEFAIFKAAHVLDESSNWLAEMNEKLKAHTCNCGTESRR